MALAGEAPERGVMARPPTPLGESLLGHDRGRAIVLRAAALTVLTLVPAYVLWDGGDEALADRAVGASVVLRMIGQQQMRMKRRRGADWMPS